MTAQASRTPLPNSRSAYSKEQMMLTFAFMSYYGFGLNDKDLKNAQKIRTNIEKALQNWQPVMNNWSLVWGPGLFHFKGDRYDDNMMFVVQNNTTHEYVVAVRGTNPLSMRDWLFEDFAVARMVDWQVKKTTKNKTLFNSFFKRGKPKISRATSIGLTKLLAMRPQADFAGEGQTIIEFLAKNMSTHTSTVNIDKSAIKLCVTGHSLGGALAPTLALWLKEQQDDHLPKNVEISTVAFAGPSAGNGDFAKYSNQMLGKSCIRIANSLDVVPHAWNTQSIRKLFGLYDQYILFPSPLLLAEMTLMWVMSLRKGYTQINADTPPIPGRYQHLIYNYFAQAIYQHTIGYLDIMRLDKQQDIPIADLFLGQLEL